MPALLRSPDGRIKRRRRFVLMDTGDIVLVLPWLIAYTRRGDSRQRNAAREASPRRVTMWRGSKWETRNLRAEASSAGDDNLEHSGGQVPLRRPRLRVRGGPGCSTSKPHRRRKRNVRRGARMMSTHLRCSSTSSALVTPHRSLETTINDVSTCIPSPTPTSGGWSSVGAWQSFWRRFVKGPDAFPP